MDKPKNWEEQKLLMSLAEEVEELSRWDATDKEGMTTSDFQGVVMVIVMKYAHLIKVKDDTTCELFAIQLKRLYEDQAVFYRNVTRRHTIRDAIRCERTRQLATRRHRLYIQRRRWVADRRGAPAWFGWLNRGGVW